MLPFVAIVVLPCVVAHQQYWSDSPGGDCWLIWYDSGVILYRNKNLNLGVWNQFLSMYDKDSPQNYDLIPYLMSGESVGRWWKIFVVVVCKYSENPCFDHLSEIFFPP